MCDPIFRSTTVSKNFKDDEKINITAYIQNMNKGSRKSHKMPKQTRNRLEDTQFNKIDKHHFGTHKLGLTPCYSTVLPHPCEHIPLDHIPLVNTPSCDHTTLTTPSCDHPLLCSLLLSVYVLRNTYRNPIDDI